MDSKSKLALYKRNILNVLEDGEFNYRGQIYKKDYILPKTEASKNIMLDDHSYKFIKPTIIQLDKSFQATPIEIKLHRYWYHLNSSQILTLNYFYDFLGNIEKLNFLLRYIGINENALEATVEYSLDDKSEIDFAISLCNGKCVYFEVKYSETEFGAATNKTTDYLNRQNTLYSKLEMSFEDFKKHYQFARNVILGVDGNYSVFLVPKFNDKIFADYGKCRKSLINVDSFNFRLIFWEDLLTTLSNKKVQEKYFEDVSIL